MSLQSRGVIINKEMIIGSAKSVSGVLIRLTDERWGHIAFYHREFDPGSFDYVLRVIKNPDVVFEGKTGELLAAKRYRKKRWRVVVYKEKIKSDGFVITAYVTTDSGWLFKRKAIWNKKL